MRLTNLLAPRGSFVNRSSLVFGFPFVSRAPLPFSLCGSTMHRAALGTFPKIVSGHLVSAASRRWDRYTVPLLFSLFQRETVVSPASRSLRVASRRHINHGPQSPLSPLVRSSASDIRAQCLFIPVHQCTLCIVSEMHL
jgi:hypothetical protein